MRGERGFTVAEILIALMVMGVLASVAVPRFLESAEKARATTCIVYRQNIQTVAHEYIRDNSLQPGDLVPTIAQLITGKYLMGEDKCPSDGIYVWNHATIQGPKTPFLNCSVHFLAP